jgi:hypothetical protein
MDLLIRWMGIFFITVSCRCSWSNVLRHPSLGRRWMRKMQLLLCLKCGSFLGSRILLKKYLFPILIARQVSQNIYGGLSKWSILCNQIWPRISIDI